MEEPTIPRPGTALCDPGGALDPRAERFVSKLLHTVRNAMQPVQSSLSFLRLEAAPRPELLELVEGAERAHRELSALLTAAQKLLTPLELRPRRVSLAALVEEAARDVDSGPALRLAGEAAAFRADPALLQDAIGFALRVLGRTAGETPVLCTLGELAGQKGRRAVTVRLAVVGGAHPDPAPADPVRSHLTELELAATERIVAAHHGQLTFEPSATAPSALEIRLPG